MRRWIIGGSVAFFLFVIIANILTRRDIPVDELARRCAAAAPTWNNYDEDIKGMVGATPAAQWQGEPVAAAIVDGTLELTFNVKPPWRSYPFGVPILLRDPYGNIIRDTSVKPSPEGHTYVFALEPTTLQGLPWVEIHYLHQERRLPLSTQGAWKAAN